MTIEDTPDTFTWRGVKFHRPNLPYKEWHGEHDGNKFLVQRDAGHVAYYHATINGNYSRGKNPDGFSNPYAALECALEMCRTVSQAALAINTKQLGDMDALLKNPIREGNPFTWRGILFKQTPPSVVWLGAEGYLRFKVGEQGFSVPEKYIGVVEEGKERFAEEMAASKEAALLGALCKYKEFHDTKSYGALGIIRRADV